MFETVLTVTGVGVLLAVLWAAREALMLVYVSALIAMGFAPLVDIIEQPRPNVRRRVPRWLAILAIYLAIVAAFVMLGLMVIPPLVAQASALWDRLPDEFNQLQNFLIRYKLLTRRITLAEAVSNAPSGAGSNAVGTVLVALSSVVGGVFALITILILSFYLLVEANTMFAYVARFIPASRRGDVLMGVPYFYVVALIAAIGETIPIVGPIIGGITAVAVAITVSAKLALMVGAFFLVLHQLEANVLVPKIMERRVGVSPVAVMVALLIGGALWGIIGAILAIPTAAILSVVVEEIVADHEVRIQRVR
jgi:predicted PurR-regulated permease PerM